MKDILSVSGKPGLFKLVSQGANMAIIESLIDKKRIPAYASDKIKPLDQILIYTEEEGETNLCDVFSAIKEKEEGRTVSIDLLKANTDELRAYFAEVLPNFDRERVYTSDIKKLLKWYDILITSGITDFSTPKEDASADEAKEENETSSSLPVKGKNTPVISLKPAKSLQSRPMGAIPRKSTVGSKRGS